jgi:hypothetical protein
MDLVDKGKSHSQPFTPTMPLDTVKQLLIRDSWLMETCYELRDTIAFHADAEPLLRWLDRQPEHEAICLFSQQGKQVANVISDAPLAMLDQTIQRTLDIRTLTLGGLNDILVEILAAMPRLLEAMIHGFAVKFRLAVEFGVVEGHHVVYFCDPTSNHL